MVRINGAKTTGEPSAERLAEENAVPGIDWLMKGTRDVAADIVARRRIREIDAQEDLPETQRRALIEGALGTDTLVNLEASKKRQFTNCSCSVAGVACALNALVGKGPLITQQDLLAHVGGEWTRQSRQDGDGVTFQDFVDRTGAALEAYGMADRYGVEVFKPKKENGDSLAAMLETYAQNAADGGVSLIYFNQGEVTSDWDGPHVSVAGPYDPVRGRVAIVEVDQEIPETRWADEKAMLRALLKPAPENQGDLYGETGGIVRIFPKKEAAR